MFVVIVVFMLGSLGDTYGLPGPRRSTFNAAGGHPTFQRRWWTPKGSVADSYSALVVASSCGTPNGREFAPKEMPEAQIQANMGATGSNSGEETDAESPSETLSLDFMRAVCAQLR